MREDFVVVDCSFEAVEASRSVFDIEGDYVPASCHTLRIFLKAPEAEAEAEFESVKCFELHLELHLCTLY